jgi:equilibrative nucleoside transporter 1/2/3
VLHEHHKEGSWTDGIHEAEAVFRSGLEVEESEHGFDRSHDGSQLTIQAVITGDDNETIAVWSVVKGPATCIFLTFVVTLALFPGWTSSLRSARQCHESSRLVNDLYTPFTFVLFNVGDLTGRVLSAKLPWKRWHHVSLKLVVGALLRFAFFPSLFLCVGSNKNAFHDIQIDSDLYSMTVQILFAISNGFLVTTAFVHAPSLLPRSTHVQERSSELLTFAVAFGLLSGSLFSYPVSKLSV